MLVPSGGVIEGHRYLQGAAVSLALQLLDLTLPKVVPHQYRPVVVVQSAVNISEELAVPRLVRMTTGDPRPSQSWPGKARWSPPSFPWR